MTDYEKLDFLEALSDEPNKKTLERYLSLSKEIILSRLYLFGLKETEVPDNYEMTQLEIAAFLLNKRGAEGEVTHSENGISRTYENAGVPDSLLKRIVPFCGTFGGDDT